jgi:hypothetical protein
MDRVSQSIKDIETAYEGLQMLNTACCWPWGPLVPVPVQVSEYSIIPVLDGCFGDTSTGPHIIVFFWLTVPVLAFLMVFNNTGTRRM